MFIKTISKMVKQNRKDKKNFFLNICKDSPTSFSISYLNIHCCKSTFIMYSWVTNYPQKLTALNSKLLLPYTFYGSGLPVQLSWVLQLRVSQRTTISFGQGCGHLKAHVREDPLLISLMWLLARDISSLIYESLPRTTYSMEAHFPQSQQATEWDRVPKIEAVIFL